MRLLKISMVSMLVLTLGSVMAQSNWKTHTDKGKKYKISYPNSWSKSAQENKLTLSSPARRGAGVEVMMATMRSKVSAKAALQYRMDDYNDGRKLEQIQSLSKKDLNNLGADRGVMGTYTIQPSALFIEAVLCKNKRCYFMKAWMPLQQKEKYMDTVDKISDSLKIM